MKPLRLILYLHSLNLASCTTWSVTGQSVNGDHYSQRVRHTERGRERGGSRGGEQSGIRLIRQLTSSNRHQQRCHHSDTVLQNDGSRLFLRRLRTRRVCGQYTAAVAAKFVLNVPLRIQSRRNIVSSNGETPLFSSARHSCGYVLSLMQFCFFRPPII